MDAGTPHAVLYFSPFGQVNGSLLDAVEYSLLLRRAGLAVQLHLVGISRETVIHLITDRYRTEWCGCGNEYAWIVSHRWRWSVPRHFEGSVLSGYGTYKRLGRLVKSSNWLVLPSMWMRRDAAANRIRERPGVVFLLDQKRHSYALGSTRDYNKKLLLQALRAPVEAGAMGLINCVSAHKSWPPAELEKWLPSGWCPATTCVLTYRDGPYRKAGYVILKPPVDDLFTRFQSLLVPPVQGGYDENPRLLLEAAALGKEVIICDEVENPAAPIYAGYLENPQAKTLGLDDAVVEWMCP